MCTYFIYLTVLPYTLYYIIIVLGESLREPLLPVRRYSLIENVRDY
jgi:hypothetical protein